MGPCMGPFLLKEISSRELWFVDGLSRCYSGSVKHCKDSELEAHAGGP